MYVSVDIPTINYLQMSNTIARARKALQYMHYIRKCAPNLPLALAETRIEIEIWHWKEIWSVNFLCFVPTSGIVHV